MRQIVVMHSLPNMAGNETTHSSMLHTAERGHTAEILFLSTTFLISLLLSLLLVSVTAVLPILDAVERRRNNDDSVEIY